MPTLKYVKYFRRKWVLKHFLYLPLCLLFDGVFICIWWYHFYFVHIGFWWTNSWFDYIDDVRIKYIYKVKRKPKYNLVYDFEILFMRMRLTLKTPSMLRIWIELIFNNTTSQTTTKLDFLLKHPELFQFIDGMRTIYSSIECRNAAIYLFLNFYSLHLLI